MHWWLLLFGDCFWNPLPSCFTLCALVFGPTNQPSAWDSFTIIWKIPLASLLCWTHVYWILGFLFFGLLTPSWVHFLVASWERCTNDSFLLSLFSLSAFLFLRLFCFLYFHIRGFSHILLDPYLFVFKRVALKSATCSKGPVEWTETGWMGVGFPWCQCT